MNVVNGMKIMDFKFFQKPKKISIPKKNFYEYRNIYSNRIYLLKGSVRTP